MKAQDNPAFDERPNPLSARKAYEKPRLELYGDLAEISKAVLGSMAPDGSAHPNKHFTS